MFNQAKRLYLICLLLIIGVLAGCTSDDDSAATPLGVTGATTSEVSGESAPTPTQEIIVLPDPTPEVSVIIPDGLDDGPRTATENGEYYIFVNRTITDDFNENLQDPPASSRWIEVEATLGNESDTAITVASTHLALLDADGNRYPPQETTDFLNPPLVGAEVEAGNSYIGYARFAIPTTITPTLLEWCYDGTCAEVVQFLLDVPE